MHAKSPAASVLLLAITLLTAWALPLHAQTYSWVQRTGGDPVGTYADGATTDFAWSWSPGGLPITGHFTRTRTGAGTTYAGSQSAADTILAHRPTAPEFNHSPFAVSVGGVNGIFQFVNGGDTTPPTGTNPPGTSATVATLTFDGAVSSPPHTLIELFDAGGSVNGVDGPFACAFTASLDGQPVDTSQWTLDVEYPYASTTGAVTTGITWDGTTVRVPHYLDGALTGGNFPDTIIFLNTGTTTFDTVTATAVGLNIDTFGLGFGANAAGVGTVPAGTVQFSTAARNVAETAGAATITVRRVGGGTGAVSVPYSTSDGTAVGGTDYTPASGTLNWADGDTAAKTFTVPITNRALGTNTIVSVTLALGTPTGGAALGLPAYASVNIAQTTTPPAPVLSLTSPPDGLSVEAGSPLTLAADADDPGGLLQGLQFQIDGQPVGPPADGDSGVYNAPAPTTPGTHQVTVTGTDAQGLVYTSAHALTVTPLNLASPATSMSSLGGLDGHDVAPGSSVTFGTGAPALGASPLQRVDFYANGTVFASFDGTGTPMVFSGTRPGPTRRDASAPSGLAALFQTGYQMPAADKVVNFVAVALDALGRSTVSKATSVHSRATTDRAPVVALTGLTTNTHLKAGSTNPVGVSASDPDAPATTGAHRTDASGNQVLALLEFYINGTKVGHASSPPFAFDFTPPSSGKFVLAAVATDGAGLSTESDPVVIVADPGPPTVSLGIAGSGVATVGGSAGAVTVSRTGTDTGAPLIVSYKVAGSARAGVDYKKLSGTVTIPAGATKARIRVKPLGGASGGGNPQVKLTLRPSVDDSYVVGPVFKARIKIVEP